MVVDPMLPVGPKPKSVGMRGFRVHVESFDSTRNFRIRLVYLITC
jgi:hypothetical protein